MKLTLALLLLLPTTAAFAQPTRGLAWAWVSATGSSSTPDPGYQYNSATGVITVTWDTIGTYIVNIPNMANSITGNQGTAHAVAYNGNHHCHVTGWIASATAPTTTQTVTVQCYDPAGNRFNGQFYVLYQRESRTATEWNDAYLWADRPTLANYTPDVLFNWNSKGTANTMTRSGAGRYRAILTGLNSKVKHFGNVMVDTYGSSNGTHCQSTGWGQVGADQYVDIACNTPAGVANDTRFQLSFFSDVAFGVQTGDQQLRGAFLLADQPTAPAAYVPTLLNNYNSTGGLNRITRQSAGTYLVEIPGVLAVNSATVQVREFNAAGYCGLGVRPANQPLGGASVIVTCFSYAGAPADLQFNLLYLTNQSAAAALPAAGGPDRAKGWLSSVSNYNSTGAANSSTAIGTGVYRVSFPNLGTNGGIAYVNASANNNYCQPVIWGSNGTTQDVYVMCYAPDGTLVNATFNTLFYKESRVTTAWNSGYAKANLPISEVAYNALSNDSWNAKNSQNTVSRVSEGSYLVTFPGVGAAGGNVLIAPQGVVPTRCKVSSWQQSGADGTVSVSCYNIFGSPQDSEFTASYFNDVAFATDLASNAHQGGYVLASNSASASYTPTAAYSSTGGAILVTRSAAGTYNVHFDQMSASSTIPLVTATTTRLGDYCATGTTTAGSNSGVDIAVNCFNNTGTLADAQFALTYLTSQAPPPIFSVTAAHSGTFLQGTSQSFTVSVSNSASAATSNGTLTLNFNLPASYSFSAASGSSWTCSSTSCTYPNAVAPGSSAPTVTLQVNVSASATPGSSTAFTPSLSGGGCRIHYSFSARQRG